MKPPEIIEVDRERVGCDGGNAMGGGNAVEGHPLVYLTMDSQGKVDCPYCGRRFIRRPTDRGGEAH